MSDAEGDDDFHDESDPEPAPKKSRNDKGGDPYDVKRLFDLEAEVSDEEENDSVEEFDDDGFIDEDNGIVEDGGVVDTGFGHMALNNRKRAEDAAEEMALSRAIEQRHQNYATDEVDEETLAGTSVAQQVNQPRATDPKLWIIKCKPGSEKQIATSILQKHLSRAEGLGIYSVVTLDHVKGYVYVEADREPPVRDAIEYIDGVLFGTKPTHVPINDMVNVMTVPKKKVNLKKGSWVRMKRGKLYKGDVAQVFYFDETTQIATVKLIPRLDVDAWLKDKEEEREREREREKKGEEEKTKKRPRKKKEGPRPPQRFFNVEEIEKLDDGKGREALTSSRDPHTADPVTVFDGQSFLDGFLIKKVSIRNLQLDIVPEFEELRKFELPNTHAEDEDAVPNERQVLIDTSRMGAKAKRIPTYQVGDVVVVTEGDLKSLTGTVQAVVNDIVHVLPNHKELNDVLPIPRYQLQKYFRVGDHVKVLYGNHENETGMIVRTSDNVAVLIADISQKELQVLVSDLRECSEVSTGLKFGEYELYDLVQIDANNVGVLIKIEKDTAQVLDQNEQVKIVKAQGIKRKIDSKRAVGRDADGNGVGTGDTVTIISGQHEKEKGLVKHIHRASLFVWIKNKIQNGGIIATKTKMCRLDGMSKSRQQSINGNSQPYQRYARPQRQRRRKSDALMHRNVQITTGPWKGYVGMVKDVNEKNYTVELQTNARRLIIPKQNVIVRDDKDKYSLRDEAYMDGSRTPMHGGETPMRGGETPMRGGETPLRMATPMRPMTPSHDPFNPHMPTTPSSNMDDYGLMDEEPQPSTPNNFYPPVRTPGTPGSSFAQYQREEVHPHTPHTPGDFPRVPQTPAGADLFPAHTPHTPGGDMGFPQTPLTDYHTPNTPAVAATPATPAANIPATPSTPGGGFYFKAN
uniref:Transcription elongation factor SPT5 n=1 Tax=Arcella intermedia TaxID=1963864 RepID=A0A6B2KXD3_9EUKA|eukprot:TRINITY_DN6121_c0_g1_i1.p1 TRINITY_DN6121_c0_g1~~TRINITY_DN6121_c0_g1_i1.p1  ORF type:complete len:914 (+),score=214.44 TRINITY_DN6121_c0_g1_i1:64-2805(+)